MAFEIPRQTYTGKIAEITIGSGSGALRVGGEDVYPFHLFEGSMPNQPKIAMEVWDYDPSEEWPSAAVEPFKDVISAPDAWAKKCVNEYGADMIVLQLKSTDPNGMDRGADDVVEIAKKVAEAVDVPLALWGTGNAQKDEAVLKKISESCEGKNLALAPVEEGNHKGVGASALGYSQTIIASSPIDVNLAKQLNILLGNLGVTKDKIIIDPTTGGLGYGLEYSYSVMERIMMAALTQEDDKLQSPMISNVGNEVWKCKEAGLSINEAPTLGDPERRGILMETVAAVCYLLSGANIVILRHPESVRLVRSFIEEMTDGGKAKDVGEIHKRLDLQEADLISISPEPNRDFAKEEEPPAKEKPAQPKKKPEKPAKKAAKEPAKVEEPKVADAPKAKEEEVTKKAEAEAQAKAKEEEKAKQEEARKSEQEARARAEAEARAKAETEAKAKRDEEAKAEAEAEARAKLKAKEKEQLQAQRYQRGLAKQKLDAEKKAGKAEKLAKTPAKEQLGLIDRLMQDLDRIHRRH